MKPNNRTISLSIMQRIRKYGMFVIRVLEMVAFGLLPIAFYLVGISMGVKRNRVSVLLLAFPVFYTAIFLPLSVAFYNTVPGQPALSIFISLFIATRLLQWQTRFGPRFRSIRDQ